MPTLSPASLLRRLAAAARAAALLLLVALLPAAAAQALTFQFDTPIAGDTVAVTVDLTDAAGGDAVDVTVSIPAGEGDLLGLFGNVVSESLVSGMGVVDATGIVTQHQFKANKVWKVGGGNTMSPVKNWDWGVKLGATGSPGGVVVETAAFQLTAPGLTVAELTGAANQTFVLGVRIQGTGGAEGSAKIGMPAGTQPVEEPSTIAIEAPADGALLVASPVSVSGAVTGEGVAVDVNGIAATVTAGTFGASLPLADGVHTITATATNAAGTASDSVTVTVDTTAPVVAISAPADGTLTAQSPITVAGTVTDASPVAEVDVNGVIAPVVSGAFTAEVPLGEGANTITATAADAGGNTGSASVGVTLDTTPPAVAITSPLDGDTTSLSVIPVSGTASDTSGVTEVVVNGVVAALSGTTWSADVPLSAGGNPITATATDAAGNTASAAITVTQGAPPTVAITAPADGTLTSAGQVTVTGDAPGATAVDVNGVAANLSGSAFSATVPLVESGNTLTATATNAFGQAQASVTVTRDSTPPVVSITSPTDGAVAGQSPISVEGTVADASVVAEVDVNGALVPVVSGAFASQVPLVEGSNTITVTAQDAAGNGGSAALQVTLDTTPPTLAITAPQDGATVTTATVRVEGSVVDATALGVTVNGQPATVSGGTFSADVELVTGLNTIEVVATDAAGNPATAQIAVTFDSAPQITSTPVTTATQSQPYAYDVEAFDPDPTETLVFSLEAGPSGMTIDPVSGLVSWTPSAEQVGGVFVLVAATNTAGKQATQIYPIQVADAADPPVITSAPVTVAEPDAAFAYTVVASDPDPGDALSYGLDSGPAGMAMDAATGELTWTPTAADLGDHPVTVRATDTTGLFATQSFTVTVAVVPPISVGVGQGRNVGAGPDGATIAAFSSVSSSSFPPENAIDGGSARWQAATAADEYLRVDLAGDLAVVDRVVLQTTGTANGVRDFEVRVSRSGAPGDFTTVFSGTAASVASPQSFSFLPVQARFVELYGVNNHGGLRLEVTELEVHTREREGGIVSLGGQVVAASSEDPNGPAANAIDFDPTSAWRTASGAVSDESFTVELADGAVVPVSMVRIQATSQTTSPRTVEIAASATSPADADLVPVATAILPRDGLPHWIGFAPMGARYVRLRVLDNHGSTAAIAVRTFEVYADDQGGAQVPFDDLTEDDMDPPVAWAWEFGDGASSTMRHPVHIFAAPGTYPVTLTMTRASGLVRSETFPYTVLPLPRVDFVWAPVPSGEAEDQVAFESRATSPNGAIVEERWRFLHDGSEAVGGIPKKTYPDDGTYEVELEVLDDRLLTGRVTRPVQIENRSPAADAGLDHVVAWGEPAQLTSSVSDPSAVDEISLTCDWDFGDGATATVPLCTPQSSQVAHAYAAVGTYTATLAVEDKDGGVGQDAASVVVTRRDGALVVVGATAATPTGDVTVEARLFDAYASSEPMGGRLVTFETGTTSVSATTDATGLASATLPFVAEAPNTVAVRFAGDALYHAGSSAAAFQPAPAGEVPALGRPDGPDHRGTEFLLTFGGNFRGNRGESDVLVLVTSEVSTLVTVEAPGVGHGPLSYPVRPGEVTHIQLPNALETDESGVIEAKGVRVTAPDPVTVHGVNRLQNGTDGYLALPVDVLGTDHVVPSFGTVRPARVSVVAVEDGTSVTITPTEDMVAGPATPPTLQAGVPFTVTLDRMEVFQVGTAGPTNGSEDPTGTQVVSDKPVAVFSSAECTTIQGVLACDPLLEQVPPTHALGTEHIALTFAERGSGDWLRVVAAHDATDVTVDGTLVASLSRGEFYQHHLPFDGAAEVLTSKPAVVAQYMMSLGSNPPTGNNGLSNTGDPAMVILTPTDQFASRYVVPTVLRSDPVVNPNGDFRSYLHLVAPVAEVGGMRLDGQPLSGVTWSPIGAGGWAGARVPISWGARDLRHLSPTVPFGVTAYGVFNYDSYAFSGGARVRALDAVCTPASGTAGDGRDDDCDGLVDEELANGVDDDGDGAVDEDLAFGGVGANVAPEAFDASGTLDEDRVRKIALPAFDANGDVLAFSVVTPPSHGTLGITGSVATYTPDADFAGADSFTFLAHDGSVDSNTATVSLDVQALPDPPRIGVTPVGLATQDAAYGHTVTATDPDPGDTLAYSLVTAPAGMSIDPATGAIAWTPAAGQVRPHDVTVRVTDASGLSDTRSFTLRVQNVNDAPLVASSPPTSGLVAAPYVYGVVATDVDANDVLSFSLDTAPAGMAVDAATGEVTWTPAAGDEGPRSVTVRVTDSGGLFATQSFVIDVAGDSTPPVVSVSASPPRFDPGGSSVLTVTATDAAPIASLALTVDGSPIALSGGQATFSSSSPGVHPVIATATDASGNVGTASIRVGVTDPTDATPPLVALESPAELQTVSFLHDVIGTVDDPNLLAYELTVRRIDASGDAAAGVTLGAGSSPVISGALGELDTTLLQNGLYALRLTAEDVNGAQAEAEHAVRVDGGAKVGPVRLRFVDMVVPVVGIPISVVRSYDSRDKTPGEFGFGWRLDLAAGSLQHNREVGEGWRIEATPGDFGFPCTIVTELEAHETEVRLSEREYYVFRPTLANLFQIAGGCRADVFYELVDGSTLGATLNVLGSTDVVYLNESGELLDGGTLQRYQPTDAQLTTADGRTFDLNLERGIVALEDANGNSLVIADGGVVASTGKSITFERDGQGRITRAIDPMGQTVDYAYDAAGDLAAVTNQVAETTRFEYAPEHPHHLDRIIDPLGRAITDFGYDEDGRMVEACDLEASCTEVEHNLAGQREIQTDPTGIAVTLTYDARGNVTSRTDALGNTTLFEYDADDNLTRMEDAEGGVTTYTYDASGNLQSRTDPHAVGDDPAEFTTTFAYNARNQLTALTLPAGGTVFRDYDANGNETAVRDILGNTILGFGYGPGGVVSSETDRFGTTTHVYDGDAEPSESNDPFGRTSFMSYDANGNLVAMTDETGTGAFAYDALGRETVSDYGNGVSSVQEYETGAPDWTATSGPTLGRIERRFTPTGRLGGWVAPDGAEVTFVYDRAGRLVREIDPLGNETITTYDPAGRPETVTDAVTGATTTTERDGVGRPTRVVDALGHETLLTYTPGGLLDTRTDALGRTWQNLYTPTATTTRDPLGRDTTVERSPFGLPVRELYPDGSFRSAEYSGTTLLDESEDFPTKLTDEAGRERMLAYNGFGQLVSASDLAGNVWDYQHVEDELRVVVSPEGDLVRELTYDALGDVTQTTYADGNSRSVTYGADRNPATVTLPQGTTLSFTWDSAGRELSRTSTLGESRTFAYQPGGALLEAIDDDTGTTTYLYDHADRFAGLVQEATGAQVLYERDLLGRVEVVRTKASASAVEQVTTYSYDAVGNLVSIADPLGGITAIDYDAVGRPTERRLPNGVTTTWTYDLRDRPLTVTHTGAGGTVLASASYQRAISGEPTRITREDGSFVEIAYDAAWRIQEERFHDAGGVLQETVAYSYDLDGNRTSKATAAGTETGTYAPGFRLVSTTGPAGSAAYGYDGGGRVTSIDRPGESLDLLYDSDDQVLEASNLAAGETALYAYDAEGRRVQAQDDAGTRRYLVAPALGEGLESPHAVADATGSRLATWVYAGAQPLLRIDATGQPVYYLEDSMGSVLALADGSGAKVASFEYDAFGIEREAAGPDASVPAQLGGDFRYHGHWKEAATGLYYARARTYDPETGRFLSRDPFEGVFQEPESFHPYTWNANNPWVYTDPTGEFTLVSFSAARGVATSLRGLARAVSRLVIQEAVGRARGVVGQTIAQALKPLIPSTVLDRIAKRTSAFENFVKDSLCLPLEGAVVQDWIYFDVGVKRGSGKPTDNGKSCADHERDASPLGGGDDARPDLLFSSAEPLRLRGGGLLAGGPKSFLIGEVKFDAEFAYKSFRAAGRGAGKGKKQFPALVNHAANYSYARGVVYVSLYGLEGFKRRQMIKVAARDRVWLRFLAVVPKR